MKREKLFRTNADHASCSIRKVEASMEKYCAGKDN